MMMVLKSRAFLHCIGEFRDMVISAQAAKLRVQDFKKKIKFFKKNPKNYNLKKKQKISKISKISKKKNYGKKSKNFVGEILFLAIFFTTFSMKRGVWQIIMNALPSYDEMK
jgi:hypothetical protein